MINIFKDIEESQVQELQDALPLIAILIGKADDNLDVNELEHAKKIVHVRTFNAPEYLNAFYEEVEAKFENKLESYLKELPDDKIARNQNISDKLSGLNSILAALDPKVAYQLYRGYIRFSSEIAKASGGFLGFLSVNKDESKWVKLPMITPVEGGEEEEE